MKKRSMYHLYDMAREDTERFGMSRAASQLLPNVRLDER